MIITMPIKYCYKAIHSFYYNFYSINKYDVIKRVVLNIHTPTNSFETEVKKLHNATVLIFNSKTLSFEDFTKIYNFISEDIDDSFLEFASRIFHAEIFSECVSLADYVKEMNTTKAYFTYLIFLKRLSEYFGNYFLIPITFVEKTTDINKGTVRKYFIKGWFSNLAELNLTPSNNLFQNIRDYYTHERDAFPHIEHLYLFGSIPNGMYHRESDVDMVLKFKGAASYYTIQDTFEEIRLRNKRFFNLDTDIYELNQFVEANPSLKLTQVF